MLIGYGNYTMSFAITGQSGSGAAFLTPSSALADGRTGTVTAIRWTNGTQNISSYVQITATLTSPLDGTAKLGVAGVCNVIGLPVGTRLEIAGISQRLVYGERRELSAWALPGTSGSLVIRIYNDVNGAATIAAAAEFAIGEIFAGRCISLCTLADSSPSDTLTDPTSSRRSEGGQLWPLMRKTYRSVSGTLGRFTTTEVKGGTASPIMDGGTVPAAIDIRTLRSLIATSKVVAVCDTPSAGQGAGTVVGGLRYDQDFMQTNWMVARPTNIGQISLDRWPMWSWPVQFQEAT
jgi:hypothetical protein